MSEARQQAEEVAHELVNKFWSIPYDDDLVKLIAEAIAAEVQRAVQQERNEGQVRLANAVQRAVAVQQTKYDELRIQFQAAQEKIDQLRAKTCGVCGWSGAPYHVVCPTCYDAIRARQRAGGYDPEVGYFDAWKGSD